MIPKIVDLSHHNTVTDFHAAKAAGVLAIIHKATDGDTFRDQKYLDARVRSNQSGLLFGSYHYMRDGDGKKQADFFIRYMCTGLPVLDFEEGSSDTAEEFVQRFKEITGKIPILYGGMAWLDSFTNRSKRLGHLTVQCKRWIARYGPNAPRGEWSMWQYTDKSEVPGLGLVDGSQFRADISYLETWWKENSV